MNDSLSAASTPEAQRILRCLPSNLRAVVFDKDGLLLDTELLELQSAQAACAILGFELLREDYLAFIGYPRDANNIRLKKLFGAGFPLEAYHHERTAIRNRLFSSNINAKPGAVELVSACRLLKLKIGVATSSKRVQAIADLGAAGILEQVDVLVCRDDVSNGKPDPESFRLAVKRLGVEPSECLALEDSRAGIASARGAGLLTIMIPDLIPDDGCAAEFGATLATSLWEVYRALSALAENRV